MKKVFFLLVASASVIFTMDSCKSGEADKDGNPSIEGHADPANTGGKLGGSKVYNENVKENDSLSTVKKQD